MAQYQCNDVLPDIGIAAAGKTFNLGVSKLILCMVRFVSALRYLAVTSRPSVAGDT